MAIRAREVRRQVVASNSSVEFAEFRPGAIAAATLRNRHGDVYVEGWQFATRKVDEGTRTGLFVCYEPGKVEQGGRKRFEKVQAEAKAKRAAAKAAKNGESK